MKKENKIIDNKEVISIYNKSGQVSCGGGSGAPYILETNHSSCIIGINFTSDRQNLNSGTLITETKVYDWIKKTQKKII